MTAAAAVDDITIRADANTVAVGLVRVGTAVAVITQNIGEIGIREIRIFFATTPGRDQREQDEPKLL